MAILQITGLAIKLVDNSAAAFSVGFAIDIDIALSVELFYLQSYTLELFTESSNRTFT